jgi:hypothetical protein
VISTEVNKHVISLTSNKIRTTQNIFQIYSPEQHHPDGMDQTPCRETNIPLSKVPSKRSRPLHEDSTHDAKHSKKENHCLHPTSTQNRFSALSPDEPTDTSETFAAGETPKPPPNFVITVITLPYSNCSIKLPSSCTKSKPLPTTK